MQDNEINELVARKLGWKCSSEYIWTDPSGSFRVGPRDYCHDIAAAWGIVEKCESIIIEHGLDMHTLQLRWNCVINNSVAVSTDTAPMAICLAFLKLP